MSHLALPAGWLPNLGEAARPVANELRHGPSLAQRREGRLHPSSTPANVDHVPAADPDHGVGVAALVLCALLWSLNGPLIKLLAPAGEPLALPGVAIAFYRSLLGGVALAPLALLAARRRAGGTVTVPVALPARPAMTALAWRCASVLAFTIMTVSFVVATTRIPAASAIVLQYTAPAWVFLLAAGLLGERVRSRDLASLCIALTGVAVIFAGSWSRDAQGMLIALGSGLSYGVLIVTLRRLRDADPLCVTVTNALGSAALLAPIVALSGAFSLTGPQALYVATLGVIQFCLPYAVFSWALRRVQAGQASLILLLETVFNPILTYLAVGEVPPAATFLGGGLILVSVLVGVLTPATPSQRPGQA